MCGIFAIIGTNEQSPEIIKGYELLIPRGPDNGSLESHDNFIIGFRRLCINDVTSNGNQPFIHNGVILLCNGEIFNFKHLRNVFDIKCKSDSDCEIILHLYNKFGAEYTEYLLDGTYAALIIDTTKSRVSVIRDRMGVNPVFVGKNDNLLCFASEAKSLDLFCSSIEQINYSVVNYDLNTHNIINIKSKYFPLYMENTSPYSIHEENIRYYLTKAVTKRLLSDRPIGCLLSGGLDSSIIASILCKLIGPENVRTYSVGMEGSVDLKYAKIMSEYLGTEHKEVFFTPEQGFDMIEKVIFKTETYDITTIRASVPMCILAEYISSQTDDIVIFSGEGSDELFGGYLYFKYAPSFEDVYKESLSLLKRLPYYDVLRADRSISSHGLEIRVPFLDNDFVNYVLCNVNGKMKSPHLDGVPTLGNALSIEKYILRNAFKDYLPNEILWRQKDAFSDGCSDSNKLWKDHIADFVDKIDLDKSFISKEAQYYRNIFDSHFKNYKPSIEYWMPKWVNVKDPSARILSVFNE